MNFLVLGFVQGACVGFGIPIAQSFGSKNITDIHRYLWNGLYVCITLAFLLCVTTTIGAPALLKLIKTPDDIFSMACIYIQILFLGIPATIFYNYSASILRAFGDSKHPFYFLLLSSVLNIVLDYIAIEYFHMGVVGAAIATVVSQLLSGALNCWWLTKHIEIFRIQTEELRPSTSHIGRICIIGLPMGLEYSVSAIGAIVMQDAINTMGSAIVASQTAGEKIRHMFTLPMESVGMAMATYVGQNFGAKKYDRIQAGIRDGLILQACYCLAAWIIIFLGKRTFVHLVVDDTFPVVTDGAVQYLAVISSLFLLHGSLMIFRNTLQGLGYSFHAILSGFGELAGRSLGAWLAVHTSGYMAICYSNPLAWGISLCYCIIMVAYALRKCRSSLLFT